VLDEALVPPRVILLRGPAATLREWAATLNPKLGARDMLLVLPNGSSLPEPLAKPESAHPSAWICSGTACQAPLTGLPVVLGAL